MVSAIFFDLDDTLIDSAPAWRDGLNTANALLLARRPELSLAVVHDVWRQTSRILGAQLDAGMLTVVQVRERRWRKTLSTLDIADDALATELETMLAQTFVGGLKLFNDVNVIDRLRCRYHVGIITNGADDTGLDSQRVKAERLGLMARVDSFLASDAVGYRKPNPYIFVAAMTFAGVVPSDAVYVGDSISKDVVGANRAGMHSVLLWRNEKPPPQLDSENRPAYVIASLDELDALISTLVRQP